MVQNSISHPEIHPELRHESHSEWHSRLKRTRTNPGHSTRQLPIHQPTQPPSRQCHLKFYIGLSLNLSCSGRIGGRTRRTTTRGAFEFEITSGGEKQFYWTARKQTLGLGNTEGSREPPLLAFICSWGTRVDHQRLLAHCLQMCWNETLHFQCPTTQFEFLFKRVGRLWNLPTKETTKFHKTEDKYKYEN